MATTYLDHHLALLAHLRSILVALGDAEQVPEENHALFLERFDELLTQLPASPDENLYLGQDLICQRPWTSAATKPHRTTNPSTGIRKNSC